MPSRPRRTAISLALLAAVTLAACQPTDADEPALASDKVSVTTPEGTFTWNVELADTPQEKAQGLMFRRQMDRDAGMLFRFERTEPVAMWMKNTFIPLDMIFAASDGTIERIHTDAVPESLDIISSGVPVRFVLELNAGEARRTGLAPGQKLRHPWMDER